MSSYSMHCTVCDTSWKTRREWLSHLLTDQHQRQARQDCHQWDVGVKECVLVTYTSFPVANSNELLHHFSVGNIIVTDFVHWSQRPRIALLQFESRSVVEEICAIGPQKVGGYIVQLRRSVECLQLEWEELLSNSTFLEFKKSELGTSFSESKSPTAVVQTKTEIQTKLLNSTYLEQKSLKLEEDFAEVLKQVSFSPEQLYAATCVTKLMAASLSKYFGPEAYCHVIWLRHYYLKYVNTGKNEHTVFIDSALAGIQDNDTACSLSKNLQVTEFVKLKSTLANVTLVKSTCHNWKENLEELGTLFEIMHRSERHKFRIVTDPILAPEAYTCRLVKYLCQFDTRVGPLIQLVSCWAKLNDKKLTKSLVTRVIGDVTYSPEPSLLEWLVVFFMCNKRMIPTPRHLTSLPHHPIMFGNFDVGFKTFRNFIEQWKPSVEAPATDSYEFALNVCQLAHLFFQFCCDLNSEPYVLNMRDGELIKEHEFRSRSHRQPPTCGRLLSDEEIAMTRKKLRDESPLTIIHPLVQCQAFSFDREEFSGPEWRNALAETASNLKKFCEIFQNQKDTTSTINLRLALTCENKK